MKCKIEENAIIFKITEAEMQNLSDGVLLETRLGVSGGLFSLRLIPGLETNLSLAQNPGGASLSLHIAQDEIHNLSTLGRQKDGIKIRCRETITHVQVDLRADGKGWLDKKCC